MSRPPLALALTVAVAVATGACRPSAPPVTAARAAWAERQWPSATVHDLEAGRSLYLAKCSGCHRPPAPADHAPADWPGEIAEMRERAHLAPHEVALIERYVVTVASVP